METLEIPENAWKPITGMVHQGLFKNERSAIINIVHDLSLSKMKEFKSSMQEFETKYGVVFEDFEQQIKSAETEDFEKWDDYIEWKAYSKAYNYWKSTHGEISPWL